MNLVIITGNVAKIWDNAPSNVKLSIADNYKEYTTFIPVMCFQNTAQWAISHLKVGDHVAIQGSVGNYKGNDGYEHTTIIAHRLSFEGYRNPNKPNNNSGSRYNGYQQNNNNQPQNSARVAIPQDNTTGQFQDINFEDVEQTIPEEFNKPSLAESSIVDDLMNG